MILRCFNSVEMKISLSNFTKKMTDLENVKLTNIKNKVKSSYFLFSPILYVHNIDLI